MSSDGGFRSFFIVGAPRCGTTSLYKYLRSHPQICFARPKEPQYFTLLNHAVLAKQRAVATKESLRSDYLESFFPELSSDHKYTGEGSVSYLYSESAIELIRDVFPDSRFIVSLRNPADLLVSYHARMLFVREETEPDLAKAWGLQEARARGEKVPRLCRDPRLLLYAEVGRLAHYLEQLWRLVGKENVLTILFDDFRADPGSVYQAVLDFLELEHDGRRKFKQRRKTERYRYGWLQSLSFAKFGVPLPLRLGLHLNHSSRARRFIKPIKRWARDFNTQKGEAQAPSVPAFRPQLVEHFRPEVERLQALLGRDLSHWE
jgi:hypothetical protein